MFGNDDQLTFADESEDSFQEEKSKYKVLIVDDEPSVHDVTVLALNSISYEGHPLELLHAYSAVEAEKVLREVPDIAVILLDVVMETDSAGLDLVKVIREDLNNTLVRIILRTGQPGQAPEEEVIVQYHINDYKNKTELTTQKLFTTIISSLRSYSDLVKIELNKHGLKKVIESTSSIIKMKSIELFFNGLLEQVVSLTCHSSTSHTACLSAYISFYQKGELLFETGTSHFEEKLSRDNRINEQYKETIQSVLRDKKSLFNKEYSIFYQANEEKTALLLLLEGDIEKITLENSLLELFIKDAAITYDNLLLAHDIKESQKDTIFMLSEMAEQRSRETGKHVKRVAYIAKTIAEELGLNENEVDELFSASPMHDIGKIYISDAILKKPGPLTDEEFENMKEHAINGYDLLKNSDKKLMQVAGLIAFQHHERYDGKGYPNGLKGDEIHIYGRIVALCDVFDALSSQRIYKDAWPLEDVYKLIKDERGKQFDPKVVDALFNRLDTILAIREEYKD